MHFNFFVKPQQASKLYNVYKMKMLTGIIYIKNIIFIPFYKTCYHCKHRSLTNNIKFIS